MTETIELSVQIGAARDDFVGGRRAVTTNARTFSRGNRLPGDLFHRIYYAQCLFDRKISQDLLSSVAVSSDESVPRL
jgi:hypothetical protein